MRFTILDLIKSTATAEKHGKWYDKYLKSGGRWVTIKDEDSPLHGRHVLIDGHGFIVGGKGMPKHVIDKLNGQHKDGLPNHEPMARHNAVDETHKELGEKKFQDSKGEWSIGHVSRTTHDEKKGHEYNAYIKHEKAAGLTGGTPFGMTGGVLMRHDEGIDTLKRRIKDKSGYTPDRATLEGIMEHINKLKDAYGEQDRHYAGSDKADHQKTVEDLYNTALERAKAGGKPGIDESPYLQRSSNVKEHMKYLTKAEQEKLREAQKHLRGNSQYDTTDDHIGHNDEKFGMDTLHGFNRKLWSERVAHEKKLEEEAKAKKKAGHLAKLDTDPEFRKLAAHALAASKEGRAGETDRELGHRLFGYATTQDKSNEHWGKVREMLDKHGIDKFNGAAHLAGLAKEYEKNGGTLPGVAAPHERDGDKLYYGDKVTNGFHSGKVNKLGQKYVHVDSGQDRQWDKNSVEHHISADKNKDASTPEEHAENVMRMFHNTGSVIHGHRMTLESAVRRLIQKHHNLSSITGTLQRRAGNIPEEKEGIQLILNEIRRHQLPELIQSASIYNKDREAQFRQELDSLGGAPDRNKSFKDIEWKPGMNPYEKAAAPEPAPAPAPEPKPGKGEKAPKTGYGEGATMSVPGSKETFKHMKNLKHVHGGKWNGEHQRWEFNHDHGSDGHKALEQYASTAGIGFNLHENGKGGEAPAPAPAPAPTGGEGPEKPEVSNEGGKVGKVTIGGNSYPHKFALKTDHGAAWNKDAKAWEIAGVAHGSDKHKAIQAFASERGLTADHEHDEKPAEPEKPQGRNFSKESISDMVKQPPSLQEIKDHLKGKISEARLDQKALEVRDHLDHFRTNPHLVPYADKHAADAYKGLGEAYSTIKDLGNLRNVAELDHSQAEVERKRIKEAEEKRKRGEELSTLYPQELNKADLGYLQKNPPTLEELQNFYKSRDDIGPAHPAGSISGLGYQHGKSREEMAEDKAKGVHDAIKEYLGNPSLHKHMADHVLEKLQGINRGRVLGGGLLDHFPEHVEEAKKRATMGGYTSKIGAKITLSPKDIRTVRGVKGAGTGPAHIIKTTDPTNGRTNHAYVPVKWAGDKNRIAQLVPGVGQDGVDFIHHVLAGKDPAAFTPNESAKVKPTTKFEKFASVPDKPKEIDGFMDKAKGDLLAHGASDVAFTSKGTKAQRAKTAHIIATGFRALHHMLGGNLPPVAVTVGPTYSRALAHYSPQGRSIVIDPDKGQNSFFHEFGHFLDDAMHDFKRSGGIGSRMSGEIHNPIGSAYEKDYHPASPMHAVGQAIKGTETWKNRKKEMDGKGSSSGFTSEYRRYFDSDIESFARFFSQWAGHEGRKRGYELPADLADPEETEWAYGEKFSPEELDGVGEVFKKVLGGKGMLKGLLAFLDSFGTPRQKFVISV